MKKLIVKFFSKLKGKSYPSKMKPNDLRVGAEHFAKKFGPAIKQLSKE